VTTKHIKNTAASVHQRLLNRAKAEDRPFNELFQYYGMERFLYRLSTSDHASRFVLKGALMMTAWAAPGTRPTMDIDLLSYAKNDPDHLKKIFAEICDLPTVDDGLTFDASRIITETIKEGADYEGVRIRFTAYLDRARVPMQLDIAFGDIITPEASAMVFPVLLDYPAPIIRAYNRESVIAEKFEAMAKLGELNTRMKDFFDVWFLSRNFSFTAAALLEAIRNTFAHRQTSAGLARVVLKNAFAESESRQQQWFSFVKRNHIKHAPVQFSEAMSGIRDFLEPMLASIAGKDAPPISWGPGGPWIKSME
jgi:predicted nucleotidyltransferase component of viral defense system